MCHGLSLFDAILCKEVRSKSPFDLFFEQHLEISSHIFDANVDVCLFEDLKRQLQALLEARQAHVMLFGTCGSVHNIHV